MFILVWFVFGFFNIILAKDKNRSPGKWFVLGILFSFISTIVLGFLSKIPEEDNNDYYIEKYKKTRMDEDEIEKTVSKIIEKKEKEKQSKETAVDKENTLDSVLDNKVVNNYKILETQEPKTTEKKKSYVKNANYKIVKFKCKCGRENITFYRKSNMIYYYCECNRLYKNESLIYKKCEVINTKIIDANDLI